MKRELAAGVTAIFLLLPACSRKPAAKPDPLLEAYGVVQDTNDPQHLISLDYQQAQGARVFQTNCVWCHADATPAGPSNRSNVTPTPPLLNDGATLNPLNDQFLQNIITLGGSAMGKSAMMPPWGRTLTADEVRAVIAYIRAIAQPPYQPPARPRDGAHDRFPGRLQLRGRPAFLKAPTSSFFFVSTEMTGSVAPPTLSLRTAASPGSRRGSRYRRGRVIPAEGMALTSEALLMKER